MARTKAIHEVDSDNRPRCGADSEVVTTDRDLVTCGTCRWMNPGPLNSQNPVIEEIVNEIEAGEAPIFTRNDLAGILRYLNTNTDVFDVGIVYTMINDAMESKDDFTGLLKLDDDEIEVFVRDYADSIGKE